MWYLEGQPAVIALLVAQTPEVEVPLTFSPPRRLPPYFLQKIGESGWTGAVQLSIRQPQVITEQQRQPYQQKHSHPLLQVESQAAIALVRRGFLSHCFRQYSELALTESAAIRLALKIN